MRIITLNANGIRAAKRKGFFDWMHKQGADVVCIQETKAQHPNLEDRDFHPLGYHAYYHDALKPGYSGVAIYSRCQPDRVHYGVGWDLFDCEGRWLQTDYGDLSVVSLYMPSGSSSEARQDIKFQVMERLLDVLASPFDHDRDLGFVVELGRFGGPHDGLLVLRIGTRRELGAQSGHGGAQQVGHRGCGGSRHSFWICSTSFFSAPKASARRGSRCRPACAATYSRASSLDQALL